MNKRIAAALALALMAGGCGTGSRVSSPQSPPPSAHHHFTWIDMLFAHAGWALGADGATVYRTSDGASWKTVSRFRNVPAVGAGATLCALSPEDAWYLFAESGTEIGLYHTVDGGGHWTYQTIPFAYMAGQEGPDPLVGPFSLSFSSPSDGWLLAVPAHGMSSEPGVLYRTHDGGRSWQAIATTEPGPGPQNLPFGGEISFTSAAQGWLVGSYTADTPRLLYRTQDGGRSWTPVSFPVHQDPLLGVEAPPVFSGRLGALPVQFQNGYAEVYTSSDSGAVWQDSRGERAPNTQVSAQMDIVALKPELVAVFYSAYRNDISRTKGNTWTDVGRVPSRYLAPGMQVTEVDFVSALDGWLVIQDAYAGMRPPILLRTQDGGRTWFQG